MKSLYFGTYREAGHYWWDAKLKRHYDITVTPWDHVDGTLNPSEVQGEGAIHHKDGWTALAFANRTDDKRPGSNGAFFFDEVLTFNQAVERAWDVFGPIIERFNFELFDTALTRAERKASVPGNTAEPQKGTE